MKTKTSEIKEHSEFGGSQAERFINCTASVKLSRGIQNKSNSKADEGTAAHACLEFFIRNRKKLKDPATRKKVLKLAENKFTLIGKEKWYWDEDMIAHALNALVYIESKMKPGCKLYVEQKLDSSKFTTDNQSSTLDVCIADYRARKLYVMDYKYGKHFVEVRKNDQVIYYALAMLLKLKGWLLFDKVVCVIIQPRAFTKKSGTEREWELSVKETIRWGRKCKAAVKEALGPKPRFKIGDKWCFFCLAKPKCPEMKKRNFAKDFQD